MKKGYIFLIVFVAGIYWLVKPPAELAALMQAQEVDTEYSGIKDVDARDGDYLDLSSLAHSGLVTVVALHTPSCPGCRSLDGNLKRFLSVRPDVAVRWVQVSDNWGPSLVRRQFGIEMNVTPHVRLYNVEQQLIAADQGKSRDGANLLHEWMNSELKQDWERQHGS